MYSFFTFLYSLLLSLTHTHFFSLSYLITQLLFPFFSTSLSHSPSLTPIHFFSLSYSITQLLFLFFLSFSHSLTTHSLTHSLTLLHFLFFLPPSLILSLFTFLLFRNILTYCRCCQRPFPSNSCTFSHLPRAER